MLLMNSAYELFTDVGFHKTTIAMIAKSAGLGKGTFYLYFRDKEDIRDAVIVYKSGQILKDAIDNTVLDKPGMSFYDRLITITDYIINYLADNEKLFKFISKSLGSGLLTEKKDNDTVSAGLMDLEEFIRGLLKKREVVLKNQQLFIYTIIELINSTCYSVIIDSEPVTIEEYKPYLYNIIWLITEDQVVSEQ